METLESYRRRIAVVTEMQSVVKTMKTLAAVNIRQYETAVDSLTDFSRTLRLGFQILFPNQKAEFQSKQTSNRFGAVVFGSDQGMCGQFNERITEYFKAHVEDCSQPPSSWRTFVLGARLESQLADSPIKVSSRFELPGSLAGITPLVQVLLPELERRQAEHGFESVDIFHNRRLSASTYRPSHFRLLPPDLTSLSTRRPGEPGFRTLPTYSMDRETLLRALVRQYLFVALYRACAESLASENASRIAAMQAAERNVEEKLSELTRDFNQQRQFAITEETLDLINGFEVLTESESSTQA